MLELLSTKPTELTSDTTEGTRGDSLIVIFGCMFTSNACGNPCLILDCIDVSSKHVPSMTVFG